MMTLFLYLFVSLKLLNTQSAEQYGKSIFRQSCVAETKRKRQWCAAITTSTLLISAFLQVKPGCKWNFSSLVLDLLFSQSRLKLKKKKQELTTSFAVSIVLSVMWLFFFHNKKLYVCLKATGANPSSHRLGSGYTWDRLPFYCMLTKPTNMHVFG